MLVSCCQLVVFSKGHMSTDVGEAAHLCPCSMISAGRDNLLPSFLLGICSDPWWGVYTSGRVQQGKGKWPAFGPERRSMNHATLRGVASCALSCSCLALFIGLQCCSELVPAFHSNQYLTPASHPAKRQTLTPVTPSVQPSSRCAVRRTV